MKKNQMPVTASRSSRSDESLVCWFCCCCWVLVGGSHDCFVCFHLAFSVKSYKETESP